MPGRSVSAVWFSCAVGLVVISRVGTDTSYWLILAGLVPLGIGMGAAMTPATAAITEALPQAQQGVGSALNDLSREVGGALGTAVIGSVVTATYRSSLHLPGAPASVVDQARASFAVAIHAGGSTGAHARQAFVDGIHTGLLYAAGAAIARRRQRGRPLEERRPGPSTRRRPAAAGTGPRGGDPMNPTLPHQATPALRPRRPGSGEAAFDPLVALDALLSEVGLSSAAAGGSVSFAGEDPIVASAHRLGACIGIPLVAAAVTAVAFHRQRGGPAQDLELDLRQAVHAINPAAFWHPTLGGGPAPYPLVLDNPFLVQPYRTADGHWIMASGVYPHQVARWCRFLDVPPDPTKVAAAIARWDALDLEEAANASGLPACVVRTPDEWVAHPQGAYLADQPVIGLERIGDAPIREFGTADRPFDGIRVLSFTHAVAGPTVGRTLAEQGADVLCATRPNDYEHDFIYVEANVGSRSTYVDLDSSLGQERAAALLASADIVVNNHRGGSLERRGLEHRQLAERHPGLVYVSVTCYGSTGPWAQRGGFDMNGSAASGLMTTEGSDAEPKLPVTGLINDYITGYLGAVGATAALVKRAVEGGSWHVTVDLTRTAMWCGSLGLVDPHDAGSDDEHSLREPLAYDAPSPLGDVHMLAPPVHFSRTRPRWPDPILVPRGSSHAEWRT